MTFENVFAGAGGYPFTSLGGQDGSVRSASVVAAAFCPSSIHVSAIVEKVSSVKQTHTHRQVTHAYTHPHTQRSCHGTEKKERARRRRKATRAARATARQRRWWRETRSTWRWRVI